MMKKISLLLLAITILAIISGCTNPGIVRISPNTYMLSKEDHAGIFGSLAKMKADVISKADAFAESQGKVAIPVASSEKPVGMGPGQWASFTYEFKLVDKGDPSARGAALIPGSAVFINKTERVTVDDQSKQQPDAGSDIYSQLIKLDDLRKKGIISDAEFEVQKRKILGEH